MVDAVHLEWFDQVPCSVTVCDKSYKILYLNDRSAEVNATDGGKGLVGKNLMDCHPAEAQEKLRKVMASGRPNVYTIEKKGVKKMIYQAHWKKRGRAAGLVEITFELPRDLPNFVRT
ncbi:MAG TPA: PAS domain-containing protein [Thermoplasmata archaeon]|jgi:transcriptional regulator with PAS, ATPase and Fis domain